MKNTPIRVLWFVNTPFPAVNKYLGKPEYAGTGWWMKATINEIVKHDDIIVGVAWASNQIQKYERFEEEGSDYYLIPHQSLPARKNNILSKVWSRLCNIMNTLKPHDYNIELNDCVRAVNDFKPDLVHVWGTENFYGLVSNRINIPVLIRFQGLLNAVKEDYWGDVKWWDRILMPNEILCLLGVIKAAKNEIKIIEQNKYFEGRTLWDLSQLRKHNVSAKYFDIPVMMRPSFYKAKWSINNKKRHLIYMTARSMPPKGVASLIKAIGIVRNYIPDVQLRIGGQISNSEYGKYVKKLVSNLDLEGCVTFLGPVSEKELIDELLNAHVYVLSSYIENSCNSLIEAQMVGVPCVASYVGGTPSLVKDQETGLLFQKGDSAMLALNIRRIFDDDALASQLSNSGQKFALDRFDKNRIVSAIISAYRDILGREKEEKYDV